MLQPRADLERALIEADIVSLAVDLDRWADLNCTFHQRDGPKTALEGRVFRAKGIAQKVLSFSRGNCQPEWWRS